MAVTPAHSPTKKSRLIVKVDLTLLCHNVTVPGICCRQDVQSDISTRAKGPCLTVVRGRGVTDTFETSEFHDSATWLR